MPSGKVHAQCTLLLTVPAAIAGFKWGGEAAALASTAGCLLGLPLTPDLDQEGLSSSENWIIKWTLGLGFLWVMLWYPYARLFKHRSFFSHFPVVSTLIRLAYLAIFVAFALGLGWKPPLVRPEIALAAVAGLMLSDAAHWFLDMRLGDRPQRRRHTR